MRRHCWVGDEDGNVIVSRCIERRHAVSVDEVKSFYISIDGICTNESDSPESSNVNTTTC